MRQEHRVLVLTDIVDSTKLVSELGDVRAGAVNARVDRITRDLLAARDGLEIDKTDGFLLLFEAGPAALGFAVDLHDALDALSQEEGIRLAMRVGVHAAVVGIRENPPADVARGAKPIEVEGLAKPLAARVMSLAIGNQTLCTEAVGRTVDHPDAGSLRWADHGRWRLKGVTHPIPLAEVGRPTLAPLRPPPDSEKAWRALAGPLAPQRETLRKMSANRGVRAVVGLVTVAALAGGLAYWDATRLKTQEFARIDWSIDGPIGFGEPQPLAHRFRVTSRGGRVLLTEEVTAAGAPVEQDLPDPNQLIWGAGLLTEPRGAEPHWVFIDGWIAFNAEPSSVTAFDYTDDGLPLRLIQRHPNGIEQARAAIEPIDGGLRFRWLTPNGVPAVSLTDGVAVEELQFDDRGLLAERRFFNVTAVQPVAAGYGPHGERLERDGQGRVVKRTFLDQAGQPVAITFGYAAVETSYGADGHRVEERFFDADGAPTPNEVGCARRTYSGDGLETSCFDADGAPALAWSTNDAWRDGEELEELLAPRPAHRSVRAPTTTGYTDRLFGVGGELDALLRVALDTQGHVTRLDLEDRSGEPVPADNVWSSAVLETGADGSRLSSPRFYDTSGAPYLPRDLNKEAGYEFQPMYPRTFGFSPDGRIESMTFVDGDGNPSTAGYGWATLRIGFDRAGRPNQAALFDASGAPTEMTTGVHRLEYTLDDLGRPLEIARFDVDGAPARDTFLTHRDVMVWDDLGRIESMAFFDVDGPMNRPESHLRAAGAHRMEITYSESGRAERLTTVRADGSLGRKAHRGAECAWEQLEWDALGRFVGTACFAPDGQPMAFRGELHRETWTLNDRGEFASAAAFDVHGAPTKDDWGCERWRIDFDDEGRRLTDNCLDGDGHPAGFQGGEAVAFHFEYDDDGNVSRQYAVNAAGAVVAADPSEAPDKRIRWNERGLVIGVDRFDAEGNPSPNQRGVAFFELEYTDTGHLRRAVFRDADRAVLPEGGDVRVSRNPLGTPTRWQDHGPDGVLRLGLDIRLDPAQRVLAMEYRDANDAPLDGPCGWASGTFAREGTEVVAAYRTADGAPARLRGRDELVHQPAMKHTPSRGDVENAREDWGFGVDESVVRAEEPGRIAWCGWRLQLDESLRHPVRRTWLDAEGQPVVPDDPGYASEVIDWAGSAPSRIRYLDAGDAPMEVCGAAEIRIEAGEPKAFNAAGGAVELPEPCMDDDFRLRKARQGGS